MRFLILLSVLFLASCMSVTEDTNCVEPKVPDENKGALEEVVDVSLEIYCEDKKEAIRRSKEDNKRPF